MSFAFILTVAVLVLLVILIWREWKHMQTKIALRSTKIQLEQAISTAEIDPLTKTYNRRGLDRQAAIAIAQAKRHNRTVSLLYIDLDDFKTINDQHGHHIGDRVLRDLGQILIDETRDGDTVCRFGGDEMGVLLPETEEGVATETAERIRMAVANHEFPVNEHSVRFTVSIGVASFPGSATSMEDLVFRADAAMYHAKEKKGCVSVATFMNAM